MFIRFFKSNNASSFVFLPFIAFAIWVFGFIFPVVIPVKHTMPLYQLIAGIFTGIPWLSTFIAFLLIIGEAFVLNYIIIKNEVITKQSYLPALLYIVFMSNSSGMLLLHPPLFANLFLLLAINKLLDSYRRDIAFSQIFDAAMLVSVASLFYFPHIIFLPLLWIGLILLRPFIWREWVISIIGAILPYAFTIVFYFLNDTLDYFWHDKIVPPILSEKINVENHQSFYFMLGAGGLILLFSFGKLFGGLNTGAQKTKNGILLMIWLLLLSGLSLFAAPEISTKYFAAAAIPVSVFCSHFFVNVKKQWWAELLFLLFISSVFVNILVYYF